MMLTSERGDGSGFRPDIWDRVATTDAQGRWESNLIPAGAADVSLRLEHPDYISNRSFNEAGQLTIQQFAGTGTLMMRKGVRLTGSVTDDAGHAVAGAQVLLGSDRFGSTDPKVQTDEAGKFAIESVRPGPIVITVVAKDWAPDLRRLTAAADMSPVDFKLQPGKTLRVKVVDADGKPIQGAWIAPDTWRDCRTLHGTGLPRETDAQGIWEWKYAPADAVIYDILKRGYQDIRRKSLTAGDEIFTVTLEQPLVISGKVLDAETKEPIRKFRLITGVAFADDNPRISWDRREIIPGSDGHYSKTFFFPYNALLVRIEADGYFPADSRRVKSSEGKVTYDFSLKKGESVAGLIRGPDGKPAAGAEVGLATANAGLYIQNGRNNRSDSGVWTKTDDDGKFSFPPQTEAFDLIALHDQGVRRVAGNDLANRKQIDLEPWAKVSGNLLVSNRPAAGETVSLLYSEPFRQGQPSIYFDNKSTTDKQGRFQFDRAMAGKAYLGRQLVFGVRDGGSMSTSAN